MIKHENDYEIKKLHVLEFNQLDYRTENLDKTIINAINLSNGVYVYRSLSHLLEQNDFIEWLKEEAGLMLFNEIFVESPNYNRFHKFIPKNNERVYFIELQEENKEKFLEHYKISIRDIKNSIPFKNFIKYSEKSLFIDDPLYDQYDFIFTIGDQILLWTDIHNFLFFKAEV